VGNLASAIDELAGDDLDGMPATALSADIVELTRQRERLDAEVLRRLRRFDAVGGCEVDRALSTQAWLRHQCRVAPGAAAERVRVARRLESLPETRAAFAAGDIGYAHVRVIANTVESSDACEATVADAEPILVNVAREYDAVGVRRVAEHWRHMVDRDGFEADEHTRYERRRLHTSETFEGMVVGDFAADPENGSLIRTAIEAFAGPLPGADARTPGQRRFDALVEICRRVLDRGTPTSGGERPHLSVLVPLDTLEGRARAAGAEVSWVQQPISGEAARRLACDARVTRIITGPESQPLDVGRTTRTISPALRRAVIARDRHCVEEGCDRPPEWCEVHHIVPWIDGGETKLEDLELRCTPHHHDVHATRAPPGA
jgi:Domain of unknown function (DUF222)